ncbi:unnamed protein product [Lepeophtheirus salmonis]|uniref:(salmon louse) hypothetical protein n=1 Tax=Lepeophtheirus salmonis TaxID=72036 RepID=A0A817FDS7_LEPSM|nr:unnamed protein product [Lepeophtheirus salmonis]CAG9477831.1 unnamed protein product [Lepeophtheirus salmonis]
MRCESSEKSSPGFAVSLIILRKSHFGTLKGPDEGRKKRVTIAERIFQNRVTGTPESRPTVSAARRYKIEGNRLNNKVNKLLEEEIVKNLKELDGILFLGIRVVFPSSSRKRFFDELHRYHQGVVKMKMRSRGTMDGSRRVLSQKALKFLQSISEDQYEENKDDNWIDFHALDGLFDIALD